MFSALTAAISELTGGCLFGNLEHFGALGRIDQALHGSYIAERAVGISGAQLILAASDIRSPLSRQPN